MQKLSVAIITLNEEANIAACIAGVKKIADEIIVVDSGSSDKTVKIATELGAKCIQHTFEGYVQQKNLALLECSNEYVLSLDADERLEDKSVQEVLEQKEKDFPHDGYIFRRTGFIGTTHIKYGSWNPDKKLRLVKKEMAIWQGKGVHESLFVNSTNIYTLKGKILHYSYKNTNELLERTKKYAELAAQHLHSEGKKISPLMIYLKAWMRFVKHYFIKLGFLDGSLGWKIGKQQYCEALWKYRGLYSLSKKQS